MACRGPLVAPPALCRVPRGREGSIKVQFCDREMEIRVSRFHVRGRVPEGMRRRMLAADDTCWLCGRPGATTIDHRLPLVMGGTNDPANLAPAHSRCNSSRRASVVLPPARVALPGPPAGREP